jgi:hypothetical protein
MSNRKDLYRFAAQIAAGGVMVVGGAPATGAATGATGLAGLAGLFRDRRDAALNAAIDTAIRDAESALRDSRDFTDADFDRSKALLDTAPRSIDPSAYARTARKGQPEPQITADLLAAIDFQPDDDGPRSLLQLLFFQTVAAICAHPPVRESIKHAFALQNAQDTFEIRKEVGAFRIETRQNFEALSATVFQNQYDFGVKTGRQQAIADVSHVVELLQVTGWTSQQLFALFEVMKARNISLGELFVLISKAEG